MKTVRRKERRSFSKIDREWNLQIPNLLEVQLKSFRDFLQMDVDPLRRRSEGLQEVFTGVFPISDPRELYSLEFVAYDVGEPKYSMDECVERDLTYSAPLKARLRLITREEVDGVKRDKDVIEQEVYLGELPLITDSGTFIINGAERVIVSQLHRSPGVFFDELTHPNGKLLFTARIIPYRGSWVEFSMDVNDVMHVHIDRKRKLPVTVLMRALGFVGDRDERLLKLLCPLQQAFQGGPEDSADGSETRSVNTDAIGRRYHRVAFERIVMGNGVFRIEP